MMKDMIMFVLSICIIGGFYFISYLIVTGQIHNLDQNLVMLIGTVFGASASHATNIINYWFGSSSGSAAKDKLLYNKTPSGEHPPV